MKYLQKLSPADDYVYGNPMTVNAVIAVGHNSSRIIVIDQGATVEIRVTGSATEVAAHIDALIDDILLKESEYGDE